MTRLLGWALLMLFTGLATMWLRGVVDPLLILLMTGTGCFRGCLSP